MVLDVLVVCGIGMSQRPSPEVLLVPFMIVLLFFITVRSFFDRITIQLSTHSYPNEIRL